MFLSALRMTATSTFLIRRDFEYLNFFHIGIECIRRYIYIVLTRISILINIPTNQYFSVPMDIWCVQDASRIFSQTRDSVMKVLQPVPTVAQLFQGVYLLWTKKKSFLMKILIEKCIQFLCTFHQYAHSSPPHPLAQQFHQWNHHCRELCSRNLAVEKAVCELPAECQFCAQQLPRSEIAQHESRLCDERCVSYSLIIRFLRKFQFWNPDVFECSVWIHNLRGWGNWWVVSFS